MMPPIHKHTHARTHTKIPSSHCIARVKGLCARASSRGQIHTHTHRAALGGLKTNTASCREEEEEALVKEEGQRLQVGGSVGSLYWEKGGEKKQTKKTVLLGEGLCACMRAHLRLCVFVYVSWSDVLCNACGADGTFPKRCAFVQWGRRCASHLSPHTRLYSLRLSCRMVSLTAANTKRMFSVSVAQVK